jgi:preprotein translocase subunit SecG
MTSLMLLARVDFLHYVFAIPMALLSIFLVLVILVQRGRGGGLTGALGGMGGQSAFGTKAGDLFTRITIVVAALWVLLAMASIKVLAQRQVFDVSQKGMPIPAAKTPTIPGTTLPGTTPAEAPPPAAPASSPPAAPASSPPAAPASSPPAEATPPASKTQP